MGLRTISRILSEVNGRILCDPPQRHNGSRHNVEQHPGDQQRQADTDRTNTLPPLIAAIEEDRSGTRPVIFMLNIDQRHSIPERRDGQLRELGAPTQSTTVPYRYSTRLYRCLLYTSD